MKAIELIESASIDSVQRTARSGQGVDAPLNRGIVHQGRSVVRLDSRVDDEGAGTAPVFLVDEGAASNPPGTFVPTQFASETLAAALERSDFDKLKASLFVLLGGAGYRAAEGVMATLAFIGSLPKGTGVVFDYVAERTSPAALRDAALDALASRISLPAGRIKHLIQPQAVAAMLYGLGFRQVVDLAKQELLSEGHLVSAVI